MALCVLPPTKYASHYHFNRTTLPQQTARKSGMTLPMTASSGGGAGGRLASYEEGKLERPNWTGQTPLSRLVGALISFKPLFSLLKLGARQVFISTAEKTNVPWRQMTKEILESDVYKEMESIQNPSIVYPDYYLNPFHAYDEGNLSWLAAAEAEAATMSMVRRAIPDASSLDEANEIVRGNWLNAIEQHHQKYSGNLKIRDILDIGCSVGVSTRFLADKFSSAKLTGVDLSPYFLAVAKYKEKKIPHKSNSIQWIHANGENTSLDSQSFYIVSISYVGVDLSPYFLAVAKYKEKKAPRKSNSIQWIHANGENTSLDLQSFDIVSISYVIHECPVRATINLTKEAFRLLRPGGTFVITDTSPKSKKLQELSPILFTLMKSTEPFLDEYYLLDLEKTVKDAGFANVKMVLTDPRHRTLTATVPH